MVGARNVIRTSFGAKLVSSSCSTRARHIKNHDHKTQGFELGSYSGRPKEEGGHKPLKISVNKFTHNVLQEVGNKSKFIEHTIHSWMQPQRIRFHASNETVNDNSHKFKAAVFVWTPTNSADNAILSIRCYFQYRCAGKGFRFRMVINEEGYSSYIGGLMSINYTWSSVYTDHDFEIKISPNQSSYAIEFQFAPESSLDTAYVKDINILLEVMDGMPALPR